MRWASVFGFDVPYPDGISDSFWRHILAVWYGADDDRWVER